jgi:hypothetical protein
VTCTHLEVKVEARHLYKPVKRRLVRTMKHPTDESAPPVPIYCGEWGMFYCYVGSMECRSKTLEGIMTYLREKADELDSEELVFKPMISVRVTRDGVSRSRILFAVRSDGKTFKIRERCGYMREKQSEREWASRLNGPEWVEALVEGVKRKFAVVEECSPDFASKNGVAPYTEEAWAAAEKLRMQINKHKRAIGDLVHGNTKAVLDRIAEGGGAGLLTVKEVDGG